MSLQLSGSPLSRLTQDLALPIVSCERFKKRKDKKEKKKGNFTYLKIEIVFVQYVQHERWPGCRSLLTAWELLTVCVVGALNDFSLTD